jgi:multiple sugar transport system permease protein
VSLTPYLLLSPAAIPIVLLIVVGSGFGILLGFLDWNYLRPDHLTDWVGLRNYFALFASPDFGAAVLHTLVWAAGVVPGGFLVGLYLAVLLNEDLPGKAMFRTLILLPWAVPLVVAAIAWSFLLSPGSGPLDDALFRLGFFNLKYMNWLGNQQFAFPIVVAVQIWRTAPFFAVTLLAALQSIPRDLYSAAEIDGAGMLARFRHVTMPMLRPVAAVVLLQGLIWSFFSFTTIFIMTQGGPAGSTEVMTTYLWRQAFTQSSVGMGSAIGTLLVIFLGIVGYFWATLVMRNEVEA